MSGLRLIVLCVLPALAVALAGCGGGDEAPAQKADRKADLKVEPRLVSATNDYGFRLYRELAKTDAKNLFVSPTSMEMALGMTFNGANGETKAQMAAALGYGDMSLDDVNKANAELLALLANPDPKLDLYIANSLWMKAGAQFNDTFVKRNTDFFSAELQSVDFRAADAADRINGWVSQKTREKIKTIVSADAIREAMAVLANAIYFKAPWTTPFDVAATKPGTFTRSDGTEKSLPMMRREDDFEYLANDLFQAVRLPYGGKYVGMYVLLPKTGVGLKDIAGKLTATQWKDWLAAFATKRGEVRMPRYKADFSASLKPSLAALGMPVAFDPDKADLLGMLPPGAVTTLGNLFISDVLHKTYLAVDESGTEAAAATAVIVGITSLPPPPAFTMVVDKPFFVAIADKPTGAILFFGSIGDPQ